MKRNTATNFGELRQGDRFYFAGDSKKIAYQVTDEKFFKKSSYNLISDQGISAWPYDKEAPNDKGVVFLRHTIPQLGEECVLKDLSDGDVFHLPDNIIDEFRLDKKPGAWVVTGINTDNTPGDISAETLVVFVRKQKEARL